MFCSEPAHAAALLPRLDGRKQGQPGRHDIAPTHWHVFPSTMAKWQRPGNRSLYCVTISSLPLQSGQDFLALGCQTVFLQTTVRLVWLGHLYQFIFQRRLQIEFFKIVSSM